MVIKLGMTAEKTITAQISETGKSAFAVEIQVSGHALQGDEPEEQGGSNLGPNPYDLLTAALGECTVMTVRWYARQKNWPLEHVAATITYRKVPAPELPNAGDRKGLVDVFEKTVTIKGDRLTDEQKQKLLDVAAKCPVQRTLEGMPLMSTAGN